MPDTARLLLLHADGDHVSVLRLRWPDNPKVVNEGNTLALPLILENVGPDRVEFTEAGLILFGRIVGANGRPVVTEGYQLARAMPAITYRLNPGDTETVHVFCRLSPDDQRSLAAGRYTVLVPVEGYGNSVLDSTGAAPPPPLTVDIRPLRPR